MDGTKDTHADLAEFGRCWARAELRGDVGSLDVLLTDDFRGVGPRGVVLDKPRWLDRYASGCLVHDAFDWEDVEVRVHGDAAVAIGLQRQQSVNDGRDADGYFRLTQFLTQHDGRWKLAALHMGRIAEPLP
ncbi:nuclear transport factor 2 family protein [Streptomyces sp. NBC_01317]|uniref:nuclear transport factor 2 family protein n=1 Tax=Streptomyces sp. NBC_01317 TaxID=2903822 RepID=UPI002E14E0A3|nr:nuclear transport factor 2 family protein [Streptomyces sp. NBC_01317]